MDNIRQRSSRSNVDDGDDASTGARFSAPEKLTHQVEEKFEKQDFRVL